MQKLEFGTAGIRGILGKGEAFLNITHLHRVIDAYARYLLDNYPNAQKQGVVIGRDNRRQSKNFAQATAAILASYKFKVYFAKDICPTPVISFAIKELGAIGGINITASHNPKEFNGIKVYNHFGGQILPDEVYLLQKFFKPYKNYLKNNKQFFLKSPIFYIPQWVFQKYQAVVLKIGANHFDCSNIKIAYSPLHGTGAKFIPPIFEKLQVKAFYARLQMTNNRHFTYVKNPNPESSLAYEMVQQIGIKNACDLILVTDPDADRVGLGVWNLQTNNYTLLTGNETATLIFEYLIEINQTNDLENFYLIYSFVSTTLPKIMAIQHKISTLEIATGFKWVSAVINQQKNTKKMLFAFEESYGSLIDETISVDKDAIQSVVILVKMASFYKQKGLSLLDVMQKIYQKYGFIASDTISIDLDSQQPDQLKKLKKNFVSLDYGFEINEIVDYNKGFKTIPPNDTIIIRFQNNCWMALRPSGTEPKLKIYIFTIAKNKILANDYYQQLLTKIQTLF